MAAPRSIQKLLARVQAVHRSAGFSAPRLLLELVEIRRAPLHECVASFHGFFGAVVESQRDSAHRSDSLDVVGFGVEGGLGDPDRGRAQGQDLAPPSARLVHQLRGEYHLVDQAHLQSFIRRILAAQEPNLARFFLADQARQVGGAEPGIDAANPRTDLAEAGGIGRDGKVADYMEDVSSADCVAVDRGDDRLGNVADDFVQRLDVHPAAIASATARGLVAARAEGAVAGAGQDHHPDRTVSPGVPKGLHHLVHRLTAERVTELRPGDCDSGDPVLLLVDDVLKFHLRLLWPRRTRPRHGVYATRPEIYFPWNLGMKKFCDEFLDLG